MDDVDRGVVYPDRHPGFRTDVPFGHDVTSVRDEFSELGRVASRPIPPRLRHADAGGDARVRHGSDEVGQDGLSSAVLPREVHEHRLAHHRPRLPAAAAAAVL